MKSCDVARYQSSKDIKDEDEVFNLETKPSSLFIHINLDILFNLTIETMKSSVILTAIMVAAVGANPTPLQAEKRQLAPPPPDCGNVSEYQLCAARNSLECYAPFPAAVFEWYVPYIWCLRVRSQTR